MKISRRYKQFRWTSCREGMRPGGLELTCELFNEGEIPFGARVLDIGCGTGETVGYLTREGFDAVGIDISPALIRIARSRHGGEFFMGDASALTFDSEFDCVIAQCSLSEMNMKEALTGCKNSLKSGGKLLISDVYTDGDALKHELVIAGFEVLSFTDRQAVLAKWIADMIWNDDPLYKQLDDYTGKKYCTLVARRRL